MRFTTGTETNRRARSMIFPSREERVDVFEVVKLPRVEVRLEDAGAPSFGSIKVLSTVPTPGRLAAAIS